MGQQGLEGSEHRRKLCGPALRRSAADRVTEICDRDFDLQKSNASDFSRFWPWFQLGRLRAIIPGRARATYMWLISALE